MALREIGSPMNARHPDLLTRVEADTTKGGTAMSYFAIGIEHTKTEANVGTLWRSADLFDAAFVFTIGRRYKRQCSDTMHSWKRIPLFHFDDFADLYAHIPHDCMLVGVELDDRSIALPKYSHPKRAIYLLGAEDNGLTREARQRCHSLVQLPGRYSMNVAAAGTIVLYDRFSKRERR
jgi:tRNA G18 (ribose-2'-O)-methylase SpoU